MTHSRRTKEKLNCQNYREGGWTGEYLIIEEYTDELLSCFTNNRVPFIKAGSRLILERRTE